MEFVFQEMVFVFVEHHSEFGNIIHHSGNLDPMILWSCVTLSLSIISSIFSQIRMVTVITLVQLRKDYWVPSRFVLFLQFSNYVLFSCTIQDLGVIDASHRCHLHRSTFHKLFSEFRMLLCCFLILYRCDMPFLEKRGTASGMHSLRVSLSRNFGNTDCIEHWA